MSTTDCTVLLTPAERDSLRTAALAQAVDNLRTAADQLELAASNPDRLTLADAQTQAGIVRDDLDALAALGFGEVA